jgi:RIO kinase 1
MTMAHVSGKTMSGRLTMSSLAPQPTKTIIQRIKKIHNPKLLDRCVLFSPRLPIATPDKRSKQRSMTTVASALPGQFDDADEEEDFVQLMQSRLTVAATPTPVVQHHHVKPDVPKAKAAVATKKPLPVKITQPQPAIPLPQEDEYPEPDDDFYDSDDEYDDMEDDLTGGSISLGGARVTGMSEKKMNLSHSVSNSVTKMEHMETSKKISHTGRDDRATSEQCMDPRTRLLLFRLLSSGFLALIDGCLSTGKEANVYYAKAGGKGAALPEAAAKITEYAIKIYKTSILVFKDRDKYVAGEHRWRKGYCKSNPRKMVKVWAEKEMRNYRRLHTAGIPCPVPIVLKSHVLIMEFLGVNGWPSPRLKDANLSERRMREAYVQTVIIMRRMYQVCRLVHGDLSEYNMLWHNNEVYVIDVSQSVETDHPSALDFLRMDASNVNGFFQKAGGLHVMTTRQLFEFVTTPLEDNSPEAEMSCLDTIMNHVDETETEMMESSEQDRRVAAQQESVDEAVFMSQFLPRSLNQVADYDIQKIADGDVEETYAHAVAALTGNKQVVDAVAKKSGDNSVQSILFKDQGRSNELKEVQIDIDEQDVEAKDSVGDLVEMSEDEEDDEDSDDENSDSDDERYIKVPRTQEELAAEKTARRLERKANKLSVKGENIEKRKEKFKKKDKKRAIKKNKAKQKK